MTPASAIQPPADQAPRRSHTDRVIAAAVTTDYWRAPREIGRRDVVYDFSLRGAAIESLRDWLRANFLAMRQRIEADRAVADISGAE